MNNTFRALILNLVALNAGTLPGTVGEMAHAAFYAAVDAVDPALAAQMHGAQERAAFALSPLYGYWRSPQDRTIHVNTGQPGWLRICLVGDELAGVFFRHLMESSLPTIRLGQVHLGITEVFGAPGSHPWCGYTTLDELRSLDAAPDRWVLEFASPTAIRWGETDSRKRRVELFPQPRMAIAGLRTRWDKLTGDTWGRAFEEWVERNVVVGRIWHWESVPFPFQGQQYSGGTGKLAYHLLDDRRPAEAAHLNRLLQMAFYTGIGYKTTHGLGQVRILTQE